MGDPGSAHGAAEMMKRIRARLVPHRPEALPEAANAPRAGLLDGDFTQAPLPAFASFSLQPAVLPSPDGSYRLSDLLSYYDDMFIRAAYLSVLKREPDAAGFEYHLRDLRSGVSKVDILKALRRSPEGRVAGARIEGLRLRPVIDGLARWPLVGRFVRLAIAVWNLPVTTQIQRAEQNHFFNLVLHLQRALESHDEVLRQRMVSLQQGFQRLYTDTLSAAGRFDTIANNLLEEARHQTEAAAQRDVALRGEVEAKAGRREVTERTNRLIELIEARSLRSEVSALGEQLMTLVKARSLKTEVDALAHQISGLAESHVGKADLTALMQQVTALMQQRALSSELKALSETLRRLVEERPSKADLAAVSARIGGLLESGPLRERLDRLAEANAMVSTALAHLERNKAAASDVDARIADVIARIEATGSAAWQRYEEAIHPLRVELRAKIGTAELASATASWQELLERRLQEPDITTDHELDAMYATFEDRFRGSRDEIKERQRIYVPHLRKVNAGKPDAPVVDVGCGRGEWLELLREEGLVARGVDLNRVFLAACEGNGLEVVESDCLKFLQSAKADSIGAITMFHIIEHLPFDVLMRVIDESLRVLKPGGLLVMETPNPSNVVVGACSFYMDPTHVRPLPSDLMQYVVQARGFADVSVLPLHPVDTAWLDGATDRASLTINHFFYGPQDYAVLGRKPKRRPNAQREGS